MSYRKKNKFAKVSPKKLSIGKENIEEDG